jgi:tRNA threonylcarbamoyladenosine biosynthesis protein TsaB
MNGEISISIETSCRVGGVAFGRDDTLVACRALGPSGRHAAELVASLDILLREEGLRPVDIDQVYVSAGPGSFTGLRVGITTARTLGQMIPSAKFVSVPTALAVAENLMTTDWQHLGVLLAAKEQVVHATLFRRDPEEIEFCGQSQLATKKELMSTWPRPILLSGEGLEFLDAVWPKDVDIAPEELRLPSAEGIWQVGRRMTRREAFTPWNELLPIYARRPEAVRLWEKRNAKD